MRVKEAKLAWATTESPRLRTALGTEYKIYKCWSQPDPNGKGFMNVGGPMETKSENETKACGIERDSL